MRIGAGPAGGGETGFSLLEMLVALVLLGIVMSGGMAALGRTPAAHALEADAGRLALALAAAHADAIRTGTETRLVLDLKARVFAYPPSAAPEPFAPGTILAVRSAGELTSGQVTHLVFRPDGSASGATVSLRDGGGDEIVLKVHWLDGRPRLIRKGAQ